MENLQATGFVEMLEMIAREYCTRSVTILPWEALSVVIGSPEVAQLYRIAEMPVTLLIDREGRTASSHVGAVSKGEYKAEVEALLHEKATPIGNSTK